MSQTEPKPNAMLKISIDCIGGKTAVAGYLIGPHPPYEQMLSFMGAFTDAEIATRLPEWMAELRAEAALGRFESLAEQQARLAAQASSGECCTRKVG